MNIAIEKKALIKQFNEVQDEGLIETIKELLTPQKQNKNIRASKHALSYAPELIEINNRKYTLNYPLRCLFEKEEDHFVIKNELLDIYAVGKTGDEAEKDFNEEFDYLYQRLNSLPDENLSDRFTSIKRFINYYVKDITTW